MDKIFVWSIENEIWNKRETWEIIHPLDISNISSQF